MGRYVKAVSLKENVGPILRGIDPDDMKIASQTRKDVIAGLPNMAPPIRHHCQDPDLREERPRIGTYDGNVFLPDGIPMSETPRD